MEKRSCFDMRPLLNIWKRRGDLYFADRGALKEIILKIGLTDAEIKFRLRHKHNLLEDALRGYGLPVQSAKLVEYGIGAEVFIQDRRQAEPAPTPKEKAPAAPENVVPLARRYERNFPR